MSSAKSPIVTVLLLALSVCLCERTPSTTVHQSLEIFSKSLLKELTGNGRSNQNLVISPVGVWSLLALLTEGSVGNTEAELKSTLHLPDDYNVIRRGYRSIVKAMLKANGTSATLESGNAIFKDLNQPILPEFEYIAETHYLAAVRGVDTSNPENVAEEINSWVNSATHGHIRRLLSASDVADAKMIVGNAVFFQGFWSQPFNSTLTVTRPFYADYTPSDESPKEHSRDQRSERDEEVVANVPMMYQSGKFKLAFSDSLKAQILELPYEGDRLSMLVILPRKGISLAEVFTTLQNHTIETIFGILEAQNTFQEGEEGAEYADESIDVFLPRFSVSTQVQLKEPLQKLGIIDLFEASSSNLSKLTHMRSYVSKVIHRAELKVAEEGTVASAATVATINNFSMPTVFKANHPFIFIVVEKSTKAIIFAGKISNPSIS